MKTKQRPRYSPKPRHREVRINQELVAKLLNCGLVAYDADNRTALWFGEVLTFSDGQTACWQALWQNFLRGNLPVLQSRVLRGWNGHCTFVADLFKRHVAWNTIIVGNGKGYLWLRVPDAYLDNTHNQECADSGILAEQGTPRVITEADEVDG